MGASKSANLPRYSLSSVIHSGGQITLTVLEQRRQSEDVDGPIIILGSRVAKVTTCPSSNAVVAAESTAVVDNAHAAAAV